MKIKNPLRLATRLGAALVHTLSRTRIGVRLTAGFAILLAMTVTAVAVGWLQLRVMQAEFQEVTVNTLPAILLVGDMRTDVEEVRRNQIRLLSAADALARKRIVSAINDTRGLLKTLYETYGQDRASGEQEQAILKALGDKLQAYEKLSQQIESQAQADDSTADAGAVVQQLQDAVYGDAFSAFGAVLAQMDELKALNLQRSRDAESRGNTTYQQGQLAMAVTASVALLLGLLLSWALTHSVVLPLRGAVSAMSRIADGQLNAHIDAQGKDELADMLRALAKMQDGLQHIVSDIRATSSSVANSSGEIAAGNLDLSNRTEEQAASLEETAASMEQLTVTVQHSADTAQQVSTLAAEASRAADHGAQVVSRVVDTMQGIQHSSNRIAEIIGVIDSIAFQTNILALNAAVEAARAGEQGRGFAVVASEVRNLAQRSANAAKEIRVLIKDSADTVKNGSRLVGEAGQGMQEVRSQVRKVEDLVGTILAASREQRSGIEQINQAVGQLDRTTQQNAALVEQASAASASLNQQAGRLMQVMAVFSLPVAD
ncbi:methyl-accepting chemotaxis protein [Rhodoferax sp.]|uniref:methyl-accepting chemotaxis protein n=1 Tax=Rhodoferax sp. TaxID=50421 RepID=UPI00374DD16B